MLLGDLPVSACNRWAPLGPQRDRDGALVTISPKEYLRSPSGQKYQWEVSAWERARADEVREAAEAERLIEESMKIHETTKETT
jgi:hypothetical protein